MTKCGMLTTTTVVLSLLASGCTEPTVQDPATVSMVADDAPFTVFSEPTPIKDIPGLGRVIVQVPNGSGEADLRGALVVFPTSLKKGDPVWLVLLRHQAKPSDVGDQLVYFAKTSPLK